MSESNYVHRVINRSFEINLPISKTWFLLFGDYPSSSVNIFRVLSDMNFPECFIEEVVRSYFEESNNVRT